MLVHLLSLVRCKHDLSLPCYATTVCRKCGSCPPAALLLHGPRLRDPSAPITMLAPLYEFQRSSQPPQHVCPHQVATPRSIDPAPADALGSTT